MKITGKETIEGGEEEFLPIQGDPNTQFTIIGTGAIPGEDSDFVPLIVDEEVPQEPVLPAGPTGPPGPEGFQGPTGPSGESLRWDTTNETTAKNLEGIPEGTTFEIGTPTLDILKALLYPVVLGFDSFSIGLEDFSSPLEVGRGTFAQTAKADWTIRDPDQAEPNSLRIQRTGFQDATLIEGFQIVSVDDDLTLPTVDGTVDIDHPSYIRNTEGSINFIISLTGNDQNTYSAQQSYQWNYAIYTGKTSSETIDVSLLNYFRDSTVQGDTKSISYKINNLNGPIVRDYASTDEDIYFYWIVPERNEDENTDLNPPEYSLSTSFSDVTTSGVAQPIPMQDKGTITATNDEGIEIKYRVYRSSNRFAGLQDPGYTRIRVFKGS